jgi:CRISPR-associated protein Cas2
MGWLMTMFDLPVMDSDERRVASQFRKDLLDHGFLMIQFSVYTRPCVNFEQLKKHVSDIRGLVPPAGNVRLLFITDEQWARAD